MILRWRWSVRGEHVHVRVFVVPAAGGTGALAGLLVFREVEWIEIREELSRSRDRKWWLPRGFCHEVVADEEAPIYPDRGGRL